MDCLPELTVRGKAKAEALHAIDALVSYYRNNENRMKYALYREAGLPIGSGAVESAHRHVLQTRMKRAGQRWALPTARKMARLRAAYRTGGVARWYDALMRAQRARRRDEAIGRRNGFHFARYGRRDRDRAEKLASK